MHDAGQGRSQTHIRSSFAFTFIRSYTHLTRVRPPLPAPLPPPSPQPLTIGVYLDDVTEDMGPMEIVPLSQYDTLHALVDAAGGFTGVLSDADLDGIPLHTAVSTLGPRGTLTVHNARCVHSSKPNTTDAPRPLLLNTFASTSAKMLMAGTNGVHSRSKRGTPVVRGVEEAFAVMDTRGGGIPMAPDFTATGYLTPFIKSEDTTLKNADG